MKSPLMRPSFAPSRQAPRRLSIVSSALLPTRFGDFRAVAFTPDANGDEHIAIVRGDVSGKRRVPLRVHSECLTGDVLGSLRCDCRDQLIAALRNIGSLDRGVVLYLRQEGRGIGLSNKIRAYALQDRGFDTVEANHMLGFRDDERDYRAAADMIQALGIFSVTLMTNNPRKMAGLCSNGVRVSARRPHVIAATPYNESYLRTKQERSGHWLGLETNGSHPLRPAAGIDQLSDID